VEARIVKPQSPPETSVKSGWALLAYGLWLRVGFIGACGPAAALGELLGARPDALSALALAAGGAVLAAIAWWRIRAMLAVLDRDAAAASGGSSAAGAASGFAGSCSCASPMPADAAR
jgi:hypothetical protein